jgi:hypothetical protein
MTIYAQADPETGGRIVWGLGENLPIARGDVQVVNFPKNKSYDVTIDLIDNTNLGLEFDHSDPMWVQEGGNCPPASGINTNEIPKGSLGFPKKSGGGGDDYAKLQFKNTNQKQCTLIYQLNFIDSDGNPADPQFDPEFRNGGTGGRTSSTIVAAVAGALIGAAGTFLAAPNASPAKIFTIAAAGAVLALALSLGLQAMQERTA